GHQADRARSRPQGTAARGLPRARGCRIDPQPGRRLPADGAGQGRRLPTHGRCRVSAIDEFVAAREDLEALLIEVLGTVAGEEAMQVWDDVLPPGPVVWSRLAIHDEEDDTYTLVSIRTSAIVARVLASRMLLMPDPGPDDLLDA